MKTEKTYHAVTPRTVSALKDIVGPGNVIYGDPEKLEPYGFDVLALMHGAGSAPEAVVKPESQKQVSSIMRLADRDRIPVTPRGAGSGLAGAAVPLCGGIVLSLDRMDRILDVDKVDRVAVVEPGVITNDLCRRVEAEGLMYAGYPMSTETSLIGGNVACNAGGGKVVCYGNTRRHVLGLEVVLPTGDVLELGGRYRKSTWGYDLLDLMIGSEGTLGIFTRITVNLIAPPRGTMDMLVPFPDTETAVRAVSEVIVSEGVIPETVEFMDRICLEQSCIHHDIHLPVLQTDRAEAFLIIQLQGDSREELEALCEKAGQTCMAQGALDVFVAVSPRQSRELWRAREQFSEGVRALDPHVYFASDIVVPFSKVPDMMMALKGMEKHYGIRIPTVGHIADGNLHSGLCKPESVPPEAWPEKAEAIFDEMTRVAIRLGGVGSGEHGVGMLKRSIFLATKSETELSLMRGIKKLFDPTGILNPGKIV